MRTPATTSCVFALLLAATACSRQPPARAQYPAAVPPQAAIAAQPAPAAPASAPRAAVAAPAPADPNDPLPRFEGAVEQHARGTIARGRARGNRPDVFAKLGDSMTESASFLADIGHGWQELADQTALQSTIAFFHRHPVDADGNDSFAHQSAAAAGGWATDDALENDAVGHELDALHPAVALVLFGTNDIDRGTPEHFAQNLARILDACETRGVLAVLSTVPDRADTSAAAAAVPRFNAVITELARARALPLIDLHTALRPLPGHGLDPDGIHTSAYVTPGGDVQACNFNPAALRCGYNLRNLLTLRTLQRLRASVLDDGASPP